MIDAERVSDQESAIKIVTMGCRLNIFESEVMRRHAQDQGLKNAIIINTCAVTNEAERQSRQTVRKLSRAHPESEIIVTGCSAQINPDVYASMPEVSRVLGNHDKMQAQSFAPVIDQRVKVNDIQSIHESAQHLITGFENHVRAFIEIQNGCNHSCTFCSIPQGRGKNRSIPIAAIVDQVQKLVDQGCQEIVMAGVDITGYGEDLPGQPRLGQMLKRLLNHVPNLPRLRLSSLDPVEIDDDLFDLIAEEPRLMPHFHLSLQAGDDMILKRMKRRHLRHDAIDVVAKILTRRPNAIFGADIIAGFPTETDAMFQKSVDIIDECHLTYLHVFPYSPRRATPAARMPQLPANIVKSRAQVLRQLGQHRLSSYLSKQLNQTVEVLIESNLKGRTEQYAPVTFAHPADVEQSVGKIVQATIIEVNPEHLIARLI